MISPSIGSILYISRCFNNYQRQLTADKTLHPSQYRVISAVCRKPGCNQEELISSSGIDKTTMTHRLNALEDNGYIRREVSREDARCRLVFPTEKANAIYPSIHEQYEYFTDRVMENVSAKDQEALMRITAILRQNAKTLIEEISEGTRRKR